MEGFLSEMEKLIERVSKNENEIKEMCVIVKGMRPSDEFMKEESLAEGMLVKQVEERGFDKITLAAVDGGMVSRSLHGMDLLILRAVGVVFRYSGGKLASCEYHPGPMVEPVPRVHDSFHEAEFEASANMERQAEEARRAMEVVEKFRPDVMFMHGSVIPQHAAIPGNDSLLCGGFKDMVDSYLALFDSCAKNNVILAGVVEDNRGSRLCGILGGMLSANGMREAKFKDVLSRARDSVIVSHLLGFRERTLVFGYSSRPQDNPLLRHFGKYSSGVNSFYVRNAELDRPVRVDFLSIDGNASSLADRISSMLVFLSRNSMYAIPPMIVEADQRARLKEDDMDMLCTALKGRLGNTFSIEGLRRGQRPF